MGHILEHTKKDVHTNQADKKSEHLDWPGKYQVYLINDDYTPMDFVVMILQMFFRINYVQAVKIMLDIHHTGKGVCGIYTRDVAETKVTQVNGFARLNEHPLLCKMERL